MRTQCIVGLCVASLLTAGCAVRIQGCVLRCPDAMKTPDQIEAEGRRAALIARVSLAEASGWAPLAPEEAR